VPADFADAAALRAFLREAAGATDDRSESFGCPSSQLPTMVAERARLAAYVDTLSEAEAEALPRVPYRRVLAAAERSQVLLRIRKAWPTGEDRWHPHAVAARKPHVLSLRLGAVGTEQLPMEPLRRALARWGGRLWQVHEGSGRERPAWWTDDARDPEGFELDPALWGTYFGTETLWAPRHAEWLLYAHHEDVLYAVGEWIVARVQEAWPAWESWLPDGEWAPVRRPGDVVAGPNGAGAREEADPSGAPE
jgi:hypothetical protein